MPNQRDGGAASDGSGAHLRKTVCPLHPCGHCGRRRSRRAGPWRGKANADTKPASPTFRRSRQSATDEAVGQRPPRRLAGRRRSLGLLGLFWRRNSRRRCAKELLADLSELQSGDEAADWVHKNLPPKNTLITADADAVEAGFREQLATIEGASAARQEQLHSPPAEDPEPSVGKPFVTSH